jgi:hypothetical protein
MRWKGRAGIGEGIIKRRARRDNEKHQRRRRVMRMTRSRQNAKYALYLPTFIK